MKQLEFRRKYEPVKPIYDDKNEWKEIRNSLKERN